MSRCSYYVKYCKVPALCSQPQESLLYYDKSSALLKHSYKKCQQRTIHSKHLKVVDRQQYCQLVASNLEHKTCNNQHEIRHYVQELSNKMLQLEQHQFES